MIELYDFEQLNKKDKVFDIEYYLWNHNVLKEE